MQQQSDIASFPALQVMGQIGERSAAIFALAWLALQRPDALEDVGDIGDLRRQLEIAMEPSVGNVQPAETVRDAIMLTGLLDLAVREGNEANAVAIRQRLAMTLDSCAVAAKDDASWEVVIGLLEQAGFRDDARSLRQGLLDKRMLSRAPSGDADAFSYRARALDLFSHGQYQLAESIYRRLLQANWERPSNFVHLARVQLALGAPVEQVEESLENAWALRSEAPAYVICRIHFARALVATLRHQETEPHLRALSSALRGRGSRLDWLIEPVLQLLRDRLAQRSFEFFMELARTINDTGTAARIESI